ncbi:MAG: HEAT repeat domain-containing protein [bacterium]
MTNFGKFKPACAVNVLIKHSKNEDDEYVREEIVNALAEIGTPEAIEYLKTMANDECENVSDAAKQFLATAS